MAQYSSTTFTSQLTTTPTFPNPYIFQKLNNMKEAELFKNIMIEQEAITKC